MRIGILDCDCVEPALAQRYGQYSDMFTRALSPYPLSFSVYRAQSDPLPHHGGCAGWLITGSRHSVNEPSDWILQLARWIGLTYQNGGRIAGVCFGHQLIAHALGGQVARARQGWGVGPYENECVGSAPWLTPCSKLTLLSSHQDQVTRLPIGAHRLYRSNFCPNYSFAMGDQIFTLQGHPEFSVEYNRALAMRRRQLLGEDVFLRAQRAFVKQTDAETALQWLAQFFLHKHVQVDSTQLSPDEACKK
ncbi:glutamine amidotransferase-related protein [Ferrimonas pelagia]|uniref:Glutamine amidotransferase n=1 Tax=Ferrimonas pelagia TaxID=1177826 RepID=A0ABP9EJE5_9GAMM